VLHSQPTEEPLVTLATIPLIRRLNLRLANRLAPIASIAFMALALSSSVGCSKIRQKIEQKAAEQAVEKGTGGAVSIDNDGKGMTIHDNKGGGTVTIGENKIPEDWPSTIPIYPKGKVVQSYSGKQNGQTSFMVALETGDSANDVFTFYKTKFKGLTQSSEMTTGDMRMLVVQDPATKRDISVVVTKGNNAATMIQITTSQKG
jgi:hypothetical protein